MNQPRILLVEDDKNMGFLLKENLHMEGYLATLSQDGEDGWKQFQQRSFDLCILDIMLPKKDGLELAREIRKENPSIPLIFLTARSMKRDKIDGFTIGCDDYITKPFDTEELLHRVKALLRRSQNQVIVEEPDVLTLSDKSTFSVADRLLRINNAENRLSSKEAELLKLLSMNNGKVVSRSNILKTIWGRDDYFTSNSLDVYLTKLRKYLKGDDQLIIQNIHGHGYLLASGTTGN